MASANLWVVPFVGKFCLQIDKHGTGKMPLRIPLYRINTAPNIN
jgi:hypothetical protein